jgi:beta-glucosidase/6-phospho-beta-glucosidase/beta-galactosidase
MELATMAAVSVFRSFFLGGFECSTHRIRSGRRLDVIASSRHAEFAREDYARLREAGIVSARDGIRWHLVEPSPGRYEFQSLVPMVRAAREVGVEVIWDLVHYGWPDDLDVFSAAFVTRAGRFAAACARVLADETDGPIWVVPVNEMSFLAWAAGDVGIFHPFAKGRGDELKAQLVRAAIVSMEAMRAVAPRIRFVHTEPLINVVAARDRPEDASAARAHRDAQYAALDMLSGRLHPELGGRPEYLDVLGFNYYIHNQWVYPGGHGRTIEPSQPEYMPLWRMLQEAQQRYGRPVFIAETGIEDMARPVWLRYVGCEVRRALAEGVPVEGICLYPIVNHPGWDDDRHCHNGLWDYADASGAREAYGPLAAELAAERARFAGERDDGGNCISDDAYLLDISAHWMEIRSGREDILYAP